MNSPGRVAAVKRTETHPFVVDDKVRISDELPRDGGLIVYVDGFTRIGEEWTVRLWDPNGGRTFRLAPRYLSLVEPAS
jgi:hypothetical protein